MLRYNLIVNDDVVALDANAITGESDYAFHVVSNDGFVIGPLIATGIVTVAGVFEDNDISAPDFTLGQKRKRGAWRKNEFVHQQVIADCDRILHGSCRHLNGLNDERHSKQGHDHGDHRRFKVLANDRLPRSLGWRYYRRSRRMTVATEQARE